MRLRYRRRQTIHAPQWRTDSLRDPLRIVPPSYPPASCLELGGSSRYELLVKLASGGMATVYLGRLRGASGFSRLCAIKRPHPHILEDSHARRSLLQEARLASLLHHPNVVPIIDMTEDGHGQLALIMDYVEGESLAALLSACTAARTLLPARVAVRIALDICAGLRAVHELTDATGEPLGLVHRDVSPQNVLVGVDGIARLADFGIAKEVRSLPLTGIGTLKGKLSYMAPEYVEGQSASACGDVFALGVVLWEALANRRLFASGCPAGTLRRLLAEPAPALSEAAPWVGRHLDAVVAGALDKRSAARIQSARALGEALEAAARAADLVASHAEVGALVRTLAASSLAARSRVLQALSLADQPPPTRRAGASCEAVVPVSGVSVELGSGTISGIELTGATTLRTG